MPDHSHTEPTSADAGSASRDFEGMLSQIQPRIRGYLASILGGWADVDDLLQETNLVLIRKKDDFQQGTNFSAWAFRIAYFKATTWRRDRSREGRVVLHENEFRDLASDAEEYFANHDLALDAVGRCLASLPAADQHLIRLKYYEKRSLTDLAGQLGCLANTLHKSISRIRLALRKCVQQELRRPSDNPP